MQHLNLEEDSSNHFSSNMFAREKVVFPFAVVLVLSSVARYFSSIWFPGGWDSFWNCWGNQTMFEIMMASVKATIICVIRKIIPMAIPNQSQQTLDRASPSLLNLADSHTLQKLPLAFLSLFPKPWTWLSVCCLPAATHTIRHSKDKRVLSTQQLTKKRSNSPMCLFAGEHSINSINGDKEDLIGTYNNCCCFKTPLATIMAAEALIIVVWFLLVYSQGSQGRGIVLFHKNTFNASVGSQNPLLFFIS